MLHAYCYPVANSMANVQMSSVPFVLPTQYFAGKTHLLLRSLHSLRIPIVEKKFHIDSFFPKTATMSSRLLHGCFPVHLNLNLFKSHVSYFFYPPYPHKFQFILLLIKFISHISFTNPLYCVVHGHCIGGINQ